MFVQRHNECLWCRICCGDLNPALWQLGLDLLVLQVELVLFHLLFVVPPGPAGVAVPMDVWEDFLLPPSAPIFITG